MRTMFKTLLAGTAMFAGLLASPAHAAIVQVSDFTGLTQGPYGFETFESSAFVIPGVSYSAVGGVQFVSSHGYAKGGNPANHIGLTTNSFPRPISLDFAAPASSVGLYFGNDDACCSQGFTAYMDIFGANGLLGTISVLANMNDASDQFLGFVSDEQVTRTTVRFGNGSDVPLFVYIDDVSFNQAPAVVPEPASALLLALGLGGLAFSRRRTSAKV